MSARYYHAAAGVNNRLPGIVNRFRCTGDLTGMPLVSRPIAAHVSFLGIIEFSLVPLRVFCYVHHYRARPAGSSNMESFFNSCRNISHVFDHVIVLANRAGDPCHVRFLESVIANQVRIYLSGDGHNRN